MEARRQFSMWKNSKDGFERNPIEPHYQVTFISFGINDKEDLEFLKKIRNLEEGKDWKAWNHYKKRIGRVDEKAVDHYNRRLAKAENFYYFNVLKRNSSYLMAETENLHIER